MSLLSDTNYSPQRIYALLRLLDAQGGQLSFNSIVTWLKPTMRGVEQRGSENEHINIRQLIGAANSLGMIDNPAQNHYRLSAPVPASLEEFADAVHDRLIGLDWDHADSIVLEAYAAMVALTELEQNTSWLEVTAKDRAHRIDNAVRAGAADEDDGESNKRFNATKSSPWKRWMIFLGLGLQMPKGDLYPYPVQRLERELARLRAEKTAPSLMDIEPFMAIVAERMPYLDGGRLFKVSAELARLPPLERKLSRVMSGALRDLHDDKRLMLDPIGDAKQTYALTQEPHAIKRIKTVRLEMEAAHV